MRKMILKAAALVTICAASARGNVFITEFCSDTGNNQLFEFSEFTNLGSSPVNMSGWSEDDSNAAPNKSGHMLSGLGTLAPGESGIITQATPADFLAFWGISSSVPVVGPYTTDNLSTTADSITLFNSSGTLVDRLDYSTTKGGSADSVTRNCPPDALGKNENSHWVNSFINDGFDSFHANQKISIIGNPGIYKGESVPEPASVSVLFLGAGLVMGRQFGRRHLTA